MRDTDDIHAVVLRAEGERAFCTGIDVTEGVWWYHLNIWNQADPGFMLGPKAHKCWKPVVAAVHGMCAGGGQYFVNESDIIICSDDATFFDPHASRGVTSVLEPIGLLQRNVPLGDVLRWALLGNEERLTAETALRLGIVTEIVPRAELWGRAAAAGGGDRRPPARGDPGHRPRDLGIARHDAVGSTADRHPLHPHREPAARREAGGRTEAEAAVPVTASPWEQRLGFWWIAEDQPDRPAIVASPDGALTYGEVAGRAHQLVHLLRSRGVQPGDAIAALVPNGVDMVACSLACHEAGWYFIPLNTFLTAPRDRRPSSNTPERVRWSAHEQFGAQVATIDRAPWPRRWRSVRSTGSSHSPMRSPRDPTTMPDDRTPGSLFVYTSGTTGRPKGIRRPQEAGDPGEVANAAAVFGRAFDFVPFGGPHLVSTAMYHGGSHSYYMGALNVGHPLVIMPRFDAETALQLIERHRVFSAYMVPTQFHRLLQLPDDVRARYDVSSLHVGRPFGGAVPARGEAPDDGVVGPRDLGDVRRDGGRGDDRQAPPVAREAGHRRAGDQGRPARHPRRRRQRARARARSAASTTAPTRRRSSTSATPRRRARRTAGSCSPSATSASSTTTATCSFVTAPRT